MKESQITTFSEDEWAHLIKSNSVYTINPTRLRLSVKIGIPSTIRGSAWMLLTRSTHIQQSSKSYTSYLSTTDIPSIKNISKDVRRTFPQQEFFANPSGQASLFNILKAYSNYDTEVGYCQGMNFIAGALLMHLEEENAFWTLVSIMFDKDWRSLFKEETPRLSKLLTELEKLVRKTDEDLFNHFQDHEVEFNVFSKYFLTLFTIDQERRLGVRILDRFLTFGEAKILNFISKVLVFSRRRVLAMKSEELMQFCLKDFGAACYEFLKQKDCEFHENEEYTFL